MRVICKACGAVMFWSARRGERLDQWRHWNLEASARPVNGPRCDGRLTPWREALVCPNGETVFHSSNSAICINEELK